MKNIWHKEKPQSKYYFAYGMNTNNDEMATRCPSAVNLGKCVLDGFSLKFRLHADIDQDPHSSIEGVLWRITDDCEFALDMLEGYPYYYNKVDVVVKPETPVDGYMQNVIAMAYTMTNKGVLEPPSTIYSICVRRGYADNGLSTELLDESIQESIIHGSIATT